MTAKVEFFCSPSEERDVLEYLTTLDGTSVYEVIDGSLAAWDSFSVDDIPGHPSPLALYIHRPAHGGLIWHDSRPEIAGPTHSSMVKSLFAREGWDELGLTDRGKMIDTDLSPILCYRRGTMRNGRMGQNTVLAPPSNLQRVGPEYEQWVKRSLAWIRRRGTIVHDYRNQSDTIPNPYTIVNTIYAFRGVLADIESNNHSFEILIDGGA